jgi:hypothetical protein
MHRPQAPRDEQKSSAGVSLSGDDAVAKVRRRSAAVGLTFGRRFADDPGV